MAPFKMYQTSKKIMKKLMLIMVAIAFSLSIYSEIQNIDDSRKVSELTVEELKDIVRLIVEESIEQCSVEGTMEGRAKVNFKVEGEVIARMTCEFEEDN